jgi:hypothetical protein
MDFLDVIAYSMQKHDLVYCRIIVIFYYYARRVLESIINLLEHACTLKCTLNNLYSHGVNSKKPPHLRGKYLEPPVFSEIVKNHRFYVNSFQCALIVN